jgi:hypothetical protein
MNLNDQHRRHRVNSFIEDEIAGTNPCLQGSGEDENKRKGGSNSTLQINRCSFSPALDRERKS